MPRLPTTMEGFLALPTRRQDAILDAYDVLAALRRGEGSLRHLAKDRGTTPRNVLRHAAPGLRKDQHGRWRARATDRLPRPMRVISTEGEVEAVVRLSREASLNSLHGTTVSQVLANRPGAGAELRQFRGMRVAGYELEADQDRLEALGRRGALSWPEIYARGN